MYVAFEKACLNGEASGVLIFKGYELHHEKNFFALNQSFIVYSSSLFLSMSFGNVMFRCYDLSSMGYCFWPFQDDFAVAILLHTLSIITVLLRLVIVYYSSTLFSVSRKFNLSRLWTTSFIFVYKYLSLYESRHSKKKKKKKKKKSNKKRYNT